MGILISEILKERLIDDLVYKGKNIEAQNLSSRLKELGIKSVPNIVVCISINGYPAFPKTKKERSRKSIIKILDKYFPDRNNTLIAFLHQNCFYILTYIKHKQKIIKKVLSFTIEKIKKEINKETKVSVSIGVCLNKGKIKLLSSCCKQAVVAKRYEIFFGPDQILWSDEVIQKKTGQQPRYNKDELTLSSFIRVGDVENTKLLSKKIAREIIISNIGVLARIKLELLAMLILVSRAAQEIGVVEEVVLGKNQFYFQQILNSFDLNELENIIIQAVEEFCDLGYHLHRSKGLQIVEKAKEFIRSRYTDKITLRDIATHVYSSPYHFSRIFKSREGCSFVEYLNRIRIEHAKRLFLDPNYNITQVCFEVGFNNLNHFERIFKKYCRLTPGKYLQKIKHNH